MRWETTNSSSAARVAWSLARSPMDRLHSACAGSPSGGRAAIRINATRSRRTRFRPPPYPRTAAARESCKLNDAKPGKLQTEASISIKVNCYSSHNPLIYIFVWLQTQWRSTADALIYVHESPIVSACCNTSSTAESATESSGVIQMPSCQKCRINLRDGLIWTPPGESSGF